MNLSARAPYRSIRNSTPDAEQNIRRRTVCDCVYVCTLFSCRLCFSHSIHCFDAGSGSAQRPPLMRTMLKVKGLKEGIAVIHVEDGKREIINIAQTDVYTEKEYQKIRYNCNHVHKRYLLT